MTLFWRSPAVLLVFRLVNSVSLWRAGAQVAVTARPMFLCCGLRGRRRKPPINWIRRGDGVYKAEHVISRQFHLREMMSGAGRARQKWQRQAPGPSRAELQKLLIIKFSSLNTSGGILDQGRSPGSGLDVSC